MTAQLHPHFLAVINTEKFKFGPDGLYVHTRVVADDTSLTIEQP